MSAKHEKYSYETKKNMVLEIEKSNTSLLETADNLKIPKTTASRWYKIYLKEGLEGLNKKHKGNSNGKRKSKEPNFEPKPNESIKKELERLRAENAYLKKLNALVQERELKEKRFKQSGN